MKQYAVVMFFLFGGFISCDDGKDYLKYDVELEKTGDCTSINPLVNVEANTIGERFVFEHCLEGNEKPEYTMVRAHDTLLLKFNGGTNQRTLYKVTLDVNTRPEYHYLSIDDKVINVNIKR